MITQEVTRRNVWLYLVGLSLILLAFLLVWVANGALQSGGLQVKVGNAPVTTLAIDPADQKFFDAGHMALLMMAGHGDPLANVNPADRKFYTNDYTSSGRASTATDPLANVDPADRKFFTNEYGPGTP